MQAPDFWHADKRDMRATLLAPLGSLLAWGGRLRRAIARPWRADIPVICIGNLIAGGAGKTPVVMNLAGYLNNQGIAVHIVSRGYGGTLHGPVRVDPKQHSASDVGDEALLHARIAPTWVSRDRQAAIRAAQDAGAQAIVMDDGLQNPSVHKDISLVVVDGGYGFGNGRLIPAGPLRENLRDGLSRVDAIVLMGADEAGALDAVARAGFTDLPVWHAHLAPNEVAQTLRGARVMAFAGIGRPEKFFRTLKEMGCTVLSAFAFPDHHPFRRDELALILVRAQQEAVQVVTTEKDWVRLPSGYDEKIIAIGVDLIWRDAATSQRFVFNAIKAAAHGA